MASRYYIRNRGKKLGPLGIDKLHAMARRGRFGRHFEVSTDGKRWSPADDYPELFPAEGSGELDAVEAGKGEGQSTAFDVGEDEGSYDEPLDAYSPIVEDESPRRSSGGTSSRRRRRTTESSSSDSGEAVSRRRRGASGRAGAGRARRGSRNAEKPQPRRRTPAEDLPPARIQEDVPEKTGKKKKKKPSVFDEAETEQPRKTKRGGLMGFLFGDRKSRAAEFDDRPHLRKLTHVHDSMRDLGFTLNKLILVGSSGEKISVGEHATSGDGPHLLGLIILIGFQSRTTDVHFEPTDDGVDIRMRIDGTLVSLVHIPAEYSRRLYGIVKVLCETKMGATQEVLEGSFSTVAPNRRADYRVSFTPSVHGQKLAIRVLDTDDSPTTLRQLGAPGSYVQTISRVMQQNAGMVLMCGPTGSGKTTTLYSMLRSIDFQSRNVMTLEDPVEYQIEGITQTNIDSEHGRGFGDMLPALLRQDPDVMLIGEIRDGISAKIAMQATMTGHLVLSTVHAPDTLATVHRLLDLNADANMIAAALDLVVSQRLVRTLCEDCKRRRRVQDEDKRRLGGSARDAVCEPVGCKSCLGTGYSGRRAVFELLDVKKQLGDIIHERPSIVDLRKAVQGKKFMTLRQNGYALVGQGGTTFDEVDRVIGVE